MTRGSSAIIVGSGPNGLTAAVTLARAGVAVTVVEAADAIGGGTRTAELTRPGLVHDICSAVHPLGIASPVFGSLPLERHGLRWVHPEIPLAHPLPDGRAAVLHRSVDETAAALGDGTRWRQVFAPVVDGFPGLLEDTLRPIAHWPRHPISLARFGLRAAVPASILAGRLGTPESAALFAGSAAHLVDRLDRPFSSAAGLILTAAAHAGGWPVAQGGSASIARALADTLTESGGRIETGHPVDRLSDLPSDAAVFLDVAPGAAADILGDALPSRVTRAYRRWQHGPAAFKIDMAVDGGIPWSAEACRRAGTVHVGGWADEIVDAERAVVAGRMPPHPFVLVAQQYLCDPSRSVGDVHPIWAYAHVPHGYPGDATGVIIDQIERHAPGTRDRIVAVHTTGPAALEAYNPNYVGGDIAAGRAGGRQLLVRPRLARDPYSTGIDGIFLCSSATPPGAGVHGMCGFNAAQSWLRRNGVTSSNVGA